MGAYGRIVSHGSKRDGSTLHVHPTQCLLACGLPPTPASARDGVTSRGHHFSRSVALTARDYATFSLGARVRDAPGGITAESALFIVKTCDLALFDRPPEPLGFCLGAA